MNFPQTPEEARTCIHDNLVWFGHECGLCDGEGRHIWKDPQVGDIAHHRTLDSREVVRVEEIDSVLHVGLHIGGEVDAWPCLASNYTYTTPEVKP